MPPLPLPIGTDLLLNGDRRRRVPPDFAPTSPVGGHTTGQPSPFDWTLTTENPRLLMHIAKKADNPDVRFDPETGTLGRYYYDNNGVRVLRPMEPGELQRFKERVLEAKACYPIGAASPEELDLRHRYRHAAPLAADPAAVKALLKQISNGEFTNDEIAKRKGVSSGYDAIFNYANIPHKPLTQMTVREVDELQDRMRKEIGHSPVGKYQFQQTKLRELVGAMKIDQGQKFDPDLQ